MSSIKGFDGLSSIGSYIFSNCNFFEKSIEENVLGANLNKGYTFCTNKRRISFVNLMLIITEAAVFRFISS